MIAYVMLFSMSRRFIKPPAVENTFSNYLTSVEAMCLQWQEEIL